MDPRWFKNQIKTLIEKKNHLLKSYTAKIVDRLQKTDAELLIKSSKENFYNKLAKNLNDFNTYSKTYWSIRKTLINGKKPLLSNHYWSIIT